MTEKNFINIIIVVLIILLFFILNKVDFIKGSFWIVILLLIFITFYLINNSKLLKKSKLEFKATILLTFTGSLTASIFLILILDQIPILTLAKYSFTFGLALIFSWIFTIRSLIEYLKEKDKKEN